MNKRARVRLIVVTAAVGVIAAASYVVIRESGTSILSVEAVKAGEIDVGTRTKATGVVAAGSWDGSANPMRFEIKDDGTTGPTLSVVYGGTVPSGFGDKTVVTVTGELNDAGEFVATEMLTQCPSKYKSQKALAIDELLADGEEAVGHTVRITGTVTKGLEGGRLTVAPSAESTAQLEVIFGSQLEGLREGAMIEAAGQLDASGVFKATGISIVKQSGS